VVIRDDPSLPVPYKSRTGTLGDFVDIETENIPAQFDTGYIDNGWGNGIKELNRVFSSSARSPRAVTARGFDFGSCTARDEKHTTRYPPQRAV